MSVIIPVFNAAATLDEQLEALTLQTYKGEWEVIVVDNGSSDGSDHVARAWSDRLPNLRVVYALSRKGVSHTRNVGSRVARGAFLAICDADDVVEAKWLEAMVEAGKRCDVVGGHLDRASLNTPLAQAWRPAPSGDGLPSLGFWPYAVGANCGVRADVFEALGGWKEELAICGDDVDFSWRAKLASYRVCYAPNAVVRYRYRENPRAIARQFFNYGLVQPRLYRDYREYGMPRRSWGNVIREWRWMLIHVVDLMRSRRRRGIWMHKSAINCGRLLGSLRERALYL